ncbi:hypothetical protein [Vannielia litorea]|uniref:Uncharacterized protein n=1 Tax=Vannielia litorea TaxID=1217970 RepID=A0A1N6F7Y5_9RHOB|nr:hypothetical protein [Vannielia litorea]SIN91385.1 hypothetical protein SAMN05444002_1453 [Vannielia litorea]
MTLRAAATLALASLAPPAPALAEGARLDLACTYLKSCDQAGACSGFSGPVTLSLAPVTIDPSGTGDWRFSPEGATALPARGLSHTGPWTWQPGDGHLHTFVLTGEDSALWIRQWLPTERYPETYAEIDILTCEISG